MTDPFSALHAVRDAVRVAAAPPAAAALRARAEHAQRVRRMTIAVCAVVAVAALGVAGATGIRLADGPHHPPADPPSPSVTVDESPAPATAEPSVGVGLGIDARSIDLANAAITLPAWSVDGMRSVCPSGDRRFRNGEVTLGPGPGDASYPWKYKITKAEAVYADLDGQPGEEIVVPVTCAAVEGWRSLLAVRVRPDRTLEGVAYVTGLFYDQSRIRDGEVLVEVWDTEVDPLVEQLRGYRLRGDRFVQTSGPSRFPTGDDLAKEDVRKINFRATWLMIGGDGRDPGGVCGPGAVTIADGRGRRTAFSTNPAATVEVGKVSTGLLTGRPKPERAQALITLRCTGDGGRREEGLYALLGAGHRIEPVVSTAEVGVTGIVRHEITSDGLVRVTVRLKSGGEEARTYRMRSDLPGLERVP